MTLLPGSLIGSESEEWNVLWLYALTEGLVNPNTTREVALSGVF